MRKIFALAAAFAVICTVSARADYSQDFTAADGTTDLSDGTAIYSNDGLNQVLNNALRMTEVGTNSSDASFKIPAMAGSSAGWTATFDLEMAHSGENTPADGLSFNYGVLNGDGGDLAAEEGWSSTDDAVTFQVDTWKWDDPGQDSGWTITEVSNGGRTTPAHMGLIDDEAIIQVDDTVSGTVTISYDGVANTASYTTTGFRVNANFQDVDLGTFSGDDAFEFGFRARTGGHNQTTIIDNVQISVVPEPGTISLFGIALLGLLRLRRRVK